MNPIPLSSQAPFPHNPPGPRQPLIYFLALYVCLFLDISYKWNRTVFCDWLLSRSIFFRCLHVVVWISTSSLLYIPHYFWVIFHGLLIPHFIYPASSWWTVGFLLWSFYELMLLWTLVWYIARIYKSYGNCMFNLLRDFQFSKEEIDIPTRSVWGFQCVTSSLRLVTTVTTFLS